MYTSKLSSRRETTNSTGIKQQHNFRCGFRARSPWTASSQRNGKEPPELHKREILDGSQIIYRSDQANYVREIVQRCVVSPD
jgi:hypothetical protein